MVLLELIIHLSSWSAVSEELTGNKYKQTFHIDILSSMQRSFFKALQVSSLCLSR